MQRENSFATVIGDINHNRLYHCLPTEEGYIICGMTTRNRSSTPFIAKLAKDGDIVWCNVLPDVIGSAIRARVIGDVMMVCGNGIWLGEEGFIACLSCDDGRVLLARKTKSEVRDAVALSDGIIGCGRGEICLLNIKGTTSLGATIKVKGTNGFLRKSEWHIPELFGLHFLGNELLLVGSAHDLLFKGSSPDCLAINIDLDSLEPLWGVCFGDRSVDVVLDVVSDNRMAYLCGYTSSIGSGGYDLLVTCLDLRNGELRWCKVLGEWKDDVALSLNIVNNYLYVVGNTKSYGNGRTNIVIAKLRASTGDLISAYTIGGSGDDLTQLKSKSELMNKNLLIPGETSTWGYGSNTGLLVSWPLDWEGELEWNNEKWEPLRVTACKLHEIEWNVVAKHIETEIEKAYYLEKLYLNTKYWTPKVIISKPLGIAIPLAPTITEKHVMTVPTLTRLTVSPTVVVKVIELLRGRGVPLKSKAITVRKLIKTIRVNNLECRGFLGASNFVTLLAVDESGVNYVVKMPSEVFYNVIATGETIVIDRYKIERLKREYARLVTLNHPNIVRVVKFIDKVPCVIMEFCEGGCLSNTDISSLDLRTILEIFIQLADALVYLHENGVIHRDIKPSNVLFTKDGVPKLADFEASRLAKTVSMRSVVYTPGFSAPEQLLGVATSKSDVFALAATMYWCLTGEEPYPQECYETGKFKVRIRDIPNVPKELNEVLKRALTPDPKLRPDSREFRDTLVSIYCNLYLI